MPGREGYVGGTARDNRVFVEVVLYRSRAGIPWRDVPPRFGDFRVLHTRHLIENFFAKLKQYRALATRSDKRAVSFLGAIYLAAPVVLLH